MSPGVPREAACSRVTRVTGRPRALWCSQPCQCLSHVSRMPHRMKSRMSRRTAGALVLVLSHSASHAASLQSRTAACRAGALVRSHAVSHAMRRCFFDAGAARYPVLRPADGHESCLVCLGRLSSTGRLAAMPPGGRRPDLTQFVKPRARTHARTQRPHATPAHLPAHARSIWPARAQRILPSGLPPRPRRRSRRGALPPGGPPPSAPRVSYHRGVPPLDLSMD